MHQFFIIITGLNQYGDYVVGLKMALDADKALKHDFIKET